MENITFTILGIETFLFILDLLNFYRIKIIEKKKKKRKHHDFPHYL